MTKKEINYYMETQWHVDYGSLSRNFELPYCDVIVYKTYLQHTKLSLLIQINLTLSL